MGRRRREEAIVLKFDVTTCSRCGGERLLARECHDCQAPSKAHEIQQDLQRRQRLVHDFQTRREMPTPASMPNLESFQSEHGQTISRVLRALSEASRFGRTADDLVAAVSELDQLTATWQNLLPRPHRNRGRVIAEAIQKSSAAADCFIDVLEASDMFKAQALEQQGNKLFGESYATLAELDHLDEIDDLFSETSPSVNLYKVGHSARQVVGCDSSIRELDFALRSSFGLGSAPEGMGLEVHTMRQIALSAFDLHSFTKVLSTCDIAVGNPTKELAKSEEWRRRHARAVAFLGSAAASVQQGVFSTNGSDFEAVHRMVEAVATLRDGVLKHALATILADSEDNYFKLVRQNGGSVIKRASLAHPNFLLDENLTPALRNAGGHADIDLAGENVRIDQTSFPMAEFIDRFLAYLESTFAIFSGLTLGLARLGIHFEYNDYLSSRDRDAAISLLLGYFNLKSEAVNVEDRTMSLQISGPEPDWMSLAAMLSSACANTITHGTISLTTDSGDWIFNTSFSRFRTQLEGIEELDTKQAALRLTSIAAASSLNGTSLWSQEDWDLIKRSIIHRAEDEDLRAWVRNVRLLRQFALEAQVSIVAEACDQALAELRR